MVKKYRVEKRTWKNNQTLYILRRKDTEQINERATKYLKHKMMQKCSENTTKAIAHSLCYYYNFLSLENLSVEDVLLMDYAKQHAHFVSFLMWLKKGEHTNNEKYPNNKTCNIHLEKVFGFYDFLEKEYEDLDGKIKVLQNKKIEYYSSVGVSFSKEVKSFSGYFKAEPSRSRTITEEEFNVLLQACRGIRDKLILLILRETGFRIGELLGVKYTEDIDFDHECIRVYAREGNPNHARAKNAEFRNIRIRHETFDILTHYMSQYQEILNKTEYLFVIQKGPETGKPMNYSDICSLFARLYKRTGIRANPHMLRHLFAKTLYKAGMPLLEISHLLGHKNIQTTIMYIDIEKEEMAEDLLKMYASKEALLNIDELL